MELLILFVALIALILIGVPIGYSLGGAGIIYFLLTTESRTLSDGIGKSRLETLGSYCRRKCTLGRACGCSSKYLYHCSQYRSFTRECIA